MRFFGSAAFVCSLSGMLFASPSADVWHPPQPVPRECANKVEFEAVLLDVSRSMKRGGLFDQQLRSIEAYLTNSANPCSLVVIGSFGVTADVHDAQFLTSTGGRARLVAAVRRLHATQPSTNLDEAAKLVELLSYQLRAAYGAQANRLVVHVYSDFVSSPSVGKTDFSLGEYLARRMNGSYMRGSASDDTPEEVVQVVAAPAPGPKSVPAPPGRNQGKWVALAALAGGVLLFVLFCVIWARSRSSRRADRGVGPAALLVTESVTKDGEAPPEFVGPERRIEVAPGVPAVFSTHADSATYVAAKVPGAVEGELFRLEPLPDGCIRVQSPHARLTVNDIPLGADRRLKVDIHEPVRVRLGRREFNIIGVFGRPRETNRAYDVFDAEPLQH